jgi:hypothetical protein
MKQIIIIGVLLTGSIFLLPVQKDISGTWVLDTNEKETEMAILRLKTSEGYFTGRLDIPDQQLYDQPVTIQLKNDRMKILLDNKGTCFIEATISDSLLTGTSVVSGKENPVSFHRLKN